MPTIKDYIATIEGIFGAKTDLIVTLRSEEKDICNIYKRRTQR